MKFCNSHFFKFFFLMAVVVQILTSWHKNYKYRLKFLVTNYGTSESYSNVDITLDTTTFIPTFVQPDCGDLEWVGADGVTPIRFWLESGCNTQYTTYWVEIPSLMNGDTFIYMYYGDDQIDPESIETRMTWDSRFGFLWGNSSNSSGCEDVTELRSLNAINHGSYFIKGGASQDLFLGRGGDDHVHSQAGIYTLSGAADHVGSCESSSECTGVESISTHQHNVFFQSDSLTLKGKDGHSNNPEYYEFEYCVTPERQSSSGIPKGAVVMFPTTTGNISGLEEFSFPSGLDYYIRSGSSSGGYNDLRHHRHNIDYHSDTVWSEESSCGNAVGHFDEPGTAAFLSLSGHLHLIEDCPTDNVLISPGAHKLHFRKATEETRFQGGMITYQYCTPHCPYSMNDYTEQRDDDINCYCSGYSGGWIYGDGIYRTDSDICTAARHMNFTLPSMIRVKMVPPETSYFSATHNSITSTGIGSVNPNCNGIYMPSYRGWYGQTIACRCDAEGSGSIYANGQKDNLFVDESLICRAVKFMGIELPAIVTVTVVRDLVENLRKSSNNGVHSIAFEKHIGDCPETAEDYLGYPITSWWMCYCSETSADGVVWGTNIYTFNSSICGAAKHTERPIPNHVLFRLWGGQTDYVGSDRGGVQSRSIVFPVAPSHSIGIEVLPSLYRIDLMWSSSFVIMDPTIGDEEGSSEVCEDPPFGWERYEGLDGRFLRSTRTEGEVQSDSATYTHRHTFDCVTGVVWNNIVNLGCSDGIGNFSVASRYHNHTLSGIVKDTLGPEDIDPRHKQLRYIQRMDTSHLSVTNTLETDLKCGMFASTDYSQVCSGHGNCTSPDFCECSPNWLGSVPWSCEITRCAGILSNMSGQVCSEHGECVAPDTCDCSSNWFGDTSEVCNVTLCGGVRSDYPSVCTAHGQCIEKDFCVCDDANYSPGGLGSGKVCQNWECFGILRSDQERVCNFGNGSCIGYNNCSCEDGYYGKECELWECDNKLFNESDVCSGHGSCVSPDVCFCTIGYYDAVQWRCEEFDCHDYHRDDLDVCSGESRGKCASYNNCTCNTGYFGEECEMFMCGMSLHNETSEVCNFGNGSCIGHNNCSCEDGYFGEECELWECDNKLFNESDVCSGHGSCVSPNVCTCTIGYYDAVQWRCEEFDCFDYHRDDPRVCSGELRGKCDSYNNCTCNQGYYGDECELYMCGTYLYNDSLKVCNFGNGSCVEHDNCSCADGYYGKECEFWECDEKMYNDSEVCSGHGSCVSPDVCTCALGYYDELQWCQEFDCYDYNRDDPRVCTGLLNGKCVSYNNCTCNTGYFGEECEMFMCGLYLHNDSSSVCSSNGECIGPNNCTCNDQYYDDDCEMFDCYLIPKNDPSVCNLQNGTCDGPDDCDCEDGFEGDECYVFRCGGFLPNDTREVCSGHGRCVGGERCLCDEGYSEMYCDLYSCGGIFYNDTVDVCDRHGSCISTGVCSCDPHYFPGNNESESVGADCRNFKCFGKWRNDSRVCNHGNGTCMKHNNCSCDGVPNLYSGKECDDWYCNEVSRYDTENVCSGHGKCLLPGQCECDDRYNGTDCDEWLCFDVDKEGKSSAVCTGHGVCIAHDECECYLALISKDNKKKYYNGSKCEKFKCFGVEPNDDSVVCGGHGSCIDYDRCHCNRGYEMSSVDGGICDVWSCGKRYNFENKTVCSSRGKCVSSHTCACESGFEGDECETFRCGGFFYDDDKQFVCSGRGKCESPGKCKCKAGYSGDLCEVNMYYYYAMTPALSVFSLAVVGVVTTVVLCVLCCCVCMCVLFCLALVILGSVVVVLRYRVYKFKQLKNFDILLKEQEMEDNTGIAHLRINKNLFEVDYKDLKILSILGEGGSSSVVYKVRWKTRIVAFKCFKTRTICSSQDSFNEFEKECEILSSVSHPNILQFFGCTMKPPRVGIIMEFCENGDLNYFYNSYDNKYPFCKKLRHMMEVCEAMEHLHERSIIHRDLKTDNVLVDRNEITKLMDFGLSKIVDRISKAAKTTKIGTSYYMAPEILHSEHYDDKIDVFSMGIMMFIMITETYSDPYEGKYDSMHIEIKVSTNPDLRPRIESVNERLGGIDLDHGWITDLICKCWAHSPKDRPSCEKIGEILRNNSGRYEELWEEEEREKERKGKDDDDEEEEEEEEEEDGKIEVEEQEDDESSSSDDSSDDDVE